MIDLNNKLAALDQIYQIYDNFVSGLELACKKYCAHCCTTGPCGYGEWDCKKKECVFLTKPNEFGQRFCKKYDEIVEKEKHSRFPMFNCGCSSTLFNEVREAVVKKLQEKESE